MKRRTKAEWRGLLDEHETSGLTAAAFCRKHALCPKYFSLRRRQLDATPLAVPHKPSDFVPVSLVPPISSATLILHWGEVTLDLPPSLPADWVVQLLQGLR